VASEYVRSDCNVRIVSVYSNIGAQGNRSDPEQWFGVQNSNGTVKPSGAAYDRALRQLAGREAGPTSKVTICHPPAVAPVRGRKRLTGQRWTGDWRRQGPTPPNWRKKTCRRLVNTKTRRRAFRRFHRKSCKRRVKRHRGKHGSRVRRKHRGRAGGRSA
jgi:hypothetical protein